MGSFAGAKLIWRAMVWAMVWEAMKHATFIVTSGSSLWPGGKERRPVESWLTETLKLYKPADRVRSLTMYELQLSCSHSFAREQQVLGYFVSVTDLFGTA
jgi:hypothetical protein